jgi:hypothetical protein
MGEASKRPTDYARLRGMPDSRVIRAECQLDEMTRIVDSPEKARWHVSVSNRVGPSHFCDSAAGGLTNASASRRTI